MRGVLEIRIRIDVEEDFFFSRDYRAIGNLDDDHLRHYVLNVVDTGLLDDAIKFTKDILLEEKIENNDDLEDALEIKIYIGDDDGHLNYMVFVNGNMDEFDKNRIINSSILEDVIYKTEKLCLRYIFEERKLDSAKLQCG